MPPVPSFPIQDHANVLDTCPEWPLGAELTAHSNLGQTPCRSAVCCTSLTGDARTMQICRTTYPMLVGCLSNFPSHFCRPNGMCPSVDLLGIAKQNSGSASHPACL